MRGMPTVASVMVQSTVMAWAFGATLVWCCGSGLMLPRMRCLMPLQDAMFTT